MWFVDQMKAPAHNKKPLINPYLTKLIRLQQDGKDAISGPANWLKPPLLDISSDTDNIADILDSMCPSDGDAPELGRWHWLIGSPGNGKSAKLGQLTRLLLERGYRITSEEGVEIRDGEEDWLPYLLEVFEEGKRYRFAYLVQDASVVRSPFSESCDPARDLKEVVERAAEKGVSLLVCTNWGVLQRLFDLGHTDRKIRNQPWFRAVKTALAIETSKKNTLSIPTGSTDSKKRTVFNEVQVTFEILDNRSLLVNSEDFEKLIKKATKNSNWEVCANCSSQDLCPFKLNQEDLTLNDYRENVLKILRRAEILDGQVIVFREAVALLSLLLAGCPNDYQHNQPCNWVHDQVKKKKVFNLFSRRIPSVLFGAAKPYGLEASGGYRTHKRDNRSLQKSVLKELAKSPDCSSTACKLIKYVTQFKDLSLDVGLERLLGVNGVIPTLDPSLEPRHVAKLDEFFSDIRSLDRNHSTIGMRKIEEACLEDWNRLFSAIEDTNNSDHRQLANFWVRRWQTTCLSWIAAVTYGITTLQDELDDYLLYFKSGEKPNDYLSVIGQLEKELAELLAQETLNSNNESHLQLGANLWLTGDWVERELKPKFDTDSTKFNNFLLIELGKDHSFVVTAEKFTWLRRKTKLNLSDLSINPEILETLRRTQAQAAAESKYSLTNDDIAIIVVDEKGKKHLVERTRGYILESRLL